MYNHTQSQQGRGKDVEAVRGGMHFEPFTGVHQWDVAFTHAPARGGAFDAIGVCSDQFQSYGPSADKLLGVLVHSRSRSVALYANGELHFQGFCVATVIRDGRTGDGSGDAGVEVKPATAGQDAVADAEEEKPGVFFGAGKVLTCVLDSDAEGGTLSFECDGHPLRFRNNVPTHRRAAAGLDGDVLDKFTNVFERLDKATAVCPVVSVCPMDEQYERLEAANKRVDQLQEDLQKQRAKLLGGPGGPAVGGGDGIESKEADKEGDAKASCQEKQPKIQL